MSDLDHLLANNQAWAEQIELENPGFFAQLSQQQKPEYLWVGCSDSRVPANEIVGLLPGELFVHRNVANQVIHTDLNALSVIQYAIDVLKVKHIIVCGHYGCGGVQAAMEKQSHGLVDNWLRHVQDTHAQFSYELDSIPNIEDRSDRLCELNVIQQVLHVARLTTVEDAWRNNQSLTIHGWVYGLKDGLVNNLDVSLARKVDADDLAATLRKG